LLLERKRRDPAPVAKSISARTAPANSTSTRLVRSTVSGCA
jgi:hypothetical protein